MDTDASNVLADKLTAAFKDDSTTLIAVCRDIASDVQMGHVKLYAFVEELGPFVTDKKVDVREKGIRILSGVLAELPKDFLSEAELGFIVTFYCDRLKDHHSIVPAVLRGILAIVQMKHLPHDGPAKLFRVMFEHVQCQSQLMEDRRNIYMIFSTLLQNRAEDLKAMGPDFVYGVITAIDGERDPRNLMLLFNILPQFMKEFSLGHLTEEMFEVIACYFPVDFNPSKSEGFNITRNDLAEKLAPCLYAIPQFAEFCIPLLIDKLCSSLKVAKLDSLDLLSKSAPVFGVKGLEQHLTELWSTLRKEIMPGEDTEVKNASLKAVASIIEVISIDEPVCTSFINKIITDTNPSISNVQRSLFRPAEKLLETVAAVNKRSCTQVLQFVVPLCLGQYYSTTSYSDKIMLIDTLNSFMKISTDLGFCIKNIPELAWTDIPKLYLGELAVQHAELKTRLLLGLTIQKAYLNDMHRATLYDFICNEIESGCEKIRNACHTTISALAELYVQEVLTLIKEKLELNNGETDIQIRRLEALSAVAKTRALSTEILPKIVTMTTAVNSEISFTALMCLHKLVTSKNVDFNIQNYLHNECNIIDKLTSLSPNISDQKLSLISTVCRLIVRKLTSEQQQTIVDKYFMALNEEINETDAILIMGLFIPLRPEVDLIITENLLASLYKLAINSSNPHARNMSYRLLATLVNKMRNKECFLYTISYLKEKIDYNFESPVAVEVKQATVVLLLWLTKALVTRGSSNSQMFLDYLSNILRHDQVGQYLAQEYKTLMDKNEDTLTEDNYSTIKIFYKQRIFEHLIRQDSTFVNSSRQNYLNALIHLLEEVPVELLFIHLTKLVPILIESLSLDNGHLILSALVALKLLLDTKNIVFSDKVQCFIPRLLKLSTHETMRVRIASLECLTSYCNYPVVLINTYKQDVLEKLAVVTDDRKRLVRKAAVKARTRWFLVGAPGGIKE